MELILRKLTFCTTFFILCFTGADALVPKLSTFTKDLPDIIPTPAQFLEHLFNATYFESIKIAKAFQFVPVEPKQLTYYHFFPDNSYKSVDSSTAKIHPSQPIKFIIHGWHSTGNASWVLAMAQSYHKNGLKNIFSVDWSTLATKDYLTSATATRDIGYYAAEFLYNLVKKDKKKLSTIHVIGHSLGAQCAGFLGTQIQNLTNGTQIGRITALDAAAPLFEYPIRVPSSLRISEQDAAFVDSIHTNAGLLGMLGGFAQQDHYVDLGGPIQSGCLNINIFESIMCSHQKAHDIFNSTIISKEYVSVNCNGPLLLLANRCEKNPKVIMGEHNNATEDDGNYYITVNKDGQPDKPKGFLDNVFDFLGNIG